MNKTQSISEPSFVCELPLTTTLAHERELAIRLDAARQIYNASLAEALRVLTLMRESKDWQRARTIPKGKERSASFRDTTTRFDFKKSALDRFAIACKNACWIGEHIGPHEAQATANRAFGAVRQYAFGKRGKPRFKGKRGLHSIEGKTNESGIRWRKGRVEWSRLSIPARLDPKDTHGWQAQALAHHTKYCRIVRRVLRGRDRYFVQLVQEGQAPWKSKNPIGHSTTGLDIGPSTIAVVNETEAFFTQFCPTVEQPWAEIRRLTRALSRSRRAINPGNYTPDGTVKKGVKTWLRSQRYLELRTKLSEMETRLASERKRSHGELANRVVALGREIKTEWLSYRSFQRNYGRSVKVRAPGMFLEMLGRKAGSAGGRLVEFPTRSTRLSQTCHGCGSIERKPLSQRWHICPCGVGPVQRDLYSAFLARHIIEEKLDACQATLAWPGAEPLLRRAVSSVTQSASGSRLVSAHASTGVRADRPPKRDHRAAEAVDDVRRVRSPESHRDAA